MAGNFECFGPKPRVPVAPGQYEVGRMGKPWSEARTGKLSNAAFLDRMIKGLPIEKTGDPGAYDPFRYAEMFPEDGRANTKLPRPFDSTAFRDMSLQTGKVDSPGAVYDIQMRKYSHKLDPKVESRSVASFRSHSLQRPSSKSDVPGSGTYSPNWNSTLRNKPNSGASFRSQSSRMFVERPMTADVIGPGTYAQFDGSLYEASKRLASRSSRKKPGFGSTSAQRALPHSARRGESPGPGAYEPMEQRIRDMVRLRLKHALRSSGSPSCLGPKHDSHRKRIVI